jgi:hypothetical protein
VWNLESIPGQSIWRLIKLIGESLKFTPGEGAPAESSDQMRTDLVDLWKLLALGKLLRFVHVSFLTATIAVAQPVYQSLAREQHPARWPRSDTLDC